MSTRRSFLKSMLASGSALGIGSNVPLFLRELSAEAGDNSDERILVVIQLTGGNDGLNTIVPHRHDAYRRARPTLAIPSSEVLSIDDELGFHPSLKGFAHLLDSHRLAIVQGVGYPNPNRSHFESMDIWHTGRRKTDVRDEGWLGQALSSMSDKQLNESPAIHLGGEKQPLALASRRVAAPTIPSLKQFQLQETRAEILEGLRKASASGNPGSDLLGFVQSTQRSALEVSEQLRQRADGQSSAASYPDSALAEKLGMVARLIASGLSTRIYYVSLDGFDTHAQQPSAHAALLRQLGDAVQAFLDDLSDQQQADRVLLMCFSEFGRRLEENASEGTDHGAAAPMFFAGSQIVPGLHGELPSLTDLDAGDLKHHTDFRCLYSSILSNWLQVRSSAPIIDTSFAPYPLFS